MAKAIDSLIQSLESVSLADLDAEIDAIEVKILEVTEPLAKRRDALFAARKLIDLRTNGAPQRKPRAPRGEGKRATSKAVGSPSQPSSSVASRNGGSPVADRIGVYLASAGPSKVKTIAEQLGISYATVYGIVTENKHGSFKKTAEGEYSLS
jgi:hypothetical protein